MSLKYKTQKTNREAVLKKQEMVSINQTEISASIVLSVEPDLFLTIRSQEYCPFLAIT